MSRWNRYIYLLTHIHEPNVNHYYTAHIVVAHDSKQARSIVPYANEGNVWINPNKTNLKRIGKTNLTPQLILSKKIQCQSA